MAAAPVIFYRGRVHPLRALLIFLSTIFLGGALLAPWVYQLIQSWAAHFTFLHFLANEPFQRYLTRTFLGIALIGLWPFARSIGARSFGDVGLTKPAGQWSKFGGGLLLGFGSLALLAGMVLLIRARTWETEHSASAVLRHVLATGLTAIVVAVLEEIIFRGALFGTLRKVYRWTFALLISSAVYALLHFFERLPTLAKVGWTSGFELLPQMVRGFVDLHSLVPGFFNLTLAGVILGLAYQRFGNLYFSIGLHAGWIFWVKSYSFLTRPTAAGHSWLWGSRKLVDGWAALVVLLLVLALVSRLPAPRTQPPSS